MTTPDEALAGFAASLGPADLPPAVAERVRLHLLDAIACALAGVRAEHAAEVRGVAEVAFGGGGSTVIGGAPLSPAGATLVNGFQIAAPTLGDVHRATLTHVMPEVLPAALAAGQLGGAAGADVLCGVAAGMEVTVRLAEALDSDEYRSRGFHNPGISGAVGAACAAARTMRLSSELMGVGIGHAVSQAGGTFAALGSDGVKVHQARGALSGFLAACLAGAGVSASDQALTAPRGGLLAAYAGGGRVERLVDGLGSDWRLMDVALRRWPGASSLQPVIEASLRLRARAGEGLAEGARAIVALPPRAYGLNGSSGWSTRLAALQSARWAVAVALTDGEVWLEQTSDARLRDESVGRLAGQSVEVVEDATLPPAGARVTLRTDAGRELVEQVDVPAGDGARPLSWDEVVEKLGRAASDGGLGGRVGAISAAVQSLESAPSLADLTTLLEAT